MKNTETESTFHMDLNDETIWEVVEVEEVRREERKLN